MIIEYKDVQIGYEKHTVLKHINFVLEKKQFVFLTGNIGAGKTTFLKSIYADVLISGEKANVLGFNLIKLKKRKIPRLRKKIGFIFQDFKFLTDRNIYENLHFVLKATGWTNEVKIKTRIYEIMKLLEINELVELMPYQLSGGQLQKTAIARALLNNPPLIIADEPTANLDTNSAHHIIQTLYNLTKYDISVIVATHNQDNILQIKAPMFKIENSQLSPLQ